MNPLVIAGILAVTVASATMMISFSDGQVRYAHTAEKTSEMHAQRIAEDLTAVSRDGSLILKNTGPVPIHVREIRILDDSGRVTFAQKADHKILASQEIAVEPGPEVAAELDRIGRG